MGASCSEYKTKEVIRKWANAWLCVWAFLASRIRNTADQLASHAIIFYIDDKRSNNKYTTVYVNSASIVEDTMPDEGNDRIEKNCMYM